MYIHDCLDNNLNQRWFSDNQGRLRSYVNPFRCLEIAGGDLRQVREADMISAQNGSIDGLALDKCTSYNMIPYAQTCARPVGTLPAMRATLHVC